MPSMRFPGQPVAVTLHRMKAQSLQPVSVWTVVAVVVVVVVKAGGPRAYPKVSLE